MKVLVLCTGNSARSQMAEGLLRYHGGQHMDAYSAGIHPGEVNPMAVQAMAEFGIDISKQRSKDVSVFAGHRFDIVITVCDAAREECPVFPGARSTHWSIPDPVDLESFRSARDLLNTRIREFLSITETSERKKII